MQAEHDKFLSARTMEGWARDQESDHYRQTRIANFVLSVSQVAHDLLRLRNAFQVAHSNRDDNKESTACKEAMDYMEGTIRRRSIETFGEDIFQPGDPRSIATPSPHGPKVG